MRNILTLAGIVAAAALALPGVASAHHLTVHGEADCLQNGTYSVAWHVTNSQGAGNKATITASSRAAVAVGSVISTTSTFTETVPGSTTSLSLTLSARWENGNTRTNSGSAEGFTGCKPPDTTPPPPKVVNPKAWFWGPCGDPFYRAVLDNRRSDKGVTFVVSFKPYGEPRMTFRRYVKADKLLRTGLFDVAGRTRMTIKTGSGKLLVSKISAPNRVYKACPTGVPILHGP